MKHLTIALALFFSLHISAQDSLKVKLERIFKHPSIGFNFSIDYAYRTLANNDGRDFSDMEIKEANKIEIPKTGYSFGADAGININHHFGLEAGINYSNKGYRTMNMAGIWGSQTLLLGNQSIPGTPENIYLVYSMHYLDFPVKLNFTTGRKKLYFVSSLGLTTNVFWFYRVTSIRKFSGSKRERTTDGTNDKYRPVNYSLTAGAGIEYKINNKMNLRVEPIFKYGLLKIIDTPVTGYLWSGGINIAWYIKL